MNAPIAATDIFLARQPILDRKQHIVAYELLFRSGQANHANVLDDLSATAHVVTSVLGEMGIQSVLGTQRGFINVSADLLQSDMLELLPPDQMVLEILETVEITGAVIERCATLKRQGFTIALDDVGQLTDVQSQLLPHIDIIKLDLMLLGDDQLPQAVKRLKEFGGKLLAEKLDRPEQFATCLELGFDYFQGYYFAKPAVLSAKRADPSKLSLLKLLGLVLSDAENTELETAFKQDAKLPYNLLKLVNSVGAGTKQKINSLAQAIMVLGRRQLQRWMQLLLFAMQGDGGAFPNPLTQLAATRGKMLEIMARIAAGHDRSLSDRAYMVGVFSLLDVLLAMPMTDIMEELNLSDDMREALLARSGILGQLLLLCEQLETGDFDKVEATLTQIPGLTRADITEAQMAAIRFVSGLSESI